MKMKREDQDHPQQTIRTSDSFLNGHKSWRKLAPDNSSKPSRVLYPTTPAGLLLRFQHKKVIYGLNSFECQQTIKECGCSKEKTVNHAGQERCISCINGTPPSYYLSTLTCPSFTVLFGNSKASQPQVPWPIVTERFTVLAMQRESSVCSIFSWGNFEKIYSCLMDKNCLEFAGATLNCNLFMHSIYLLSSSKNRFCIGSLAYAGGKRGRFLAVPRFALTLLYQIIAV